VLEQRDEATRFDQEQVGVGGGDDLLGASPAGESSAAATTWT
jgi:hypothetical protein